MNVAAARDSHWWYAVFAGTPAAWLATAASMGQALGIPTYGVCSLDALGRAAGPGRVLVATDARRREVYYATYLDGARIAAAVRAVPPPSPNSWTPTGRGGPP